MKYKDPETGKYISIPVVLGDNDAEIAEEKFELIESFEVTEEIITFVRTSEPDGTPYDFQKIKVIVMQTASEKKGKGGIRCDDPSLKLGSIYIASSVESFRENPTFSQYIGYINNGVLKGIASTFVTPEDAPRDLVEAIAHSAYRNATITEPVFSVCETVKLDKIKYLRYGSLNSYPIPLGTKIYVYAVRS